MIRLRRIVARSFGSLCDLDVGELGDGLTVIYGPNEAGKTTLTALVRHVLYGFPKANALDQRYDPGSGDAAASLIFDEDGSVQTLTRTATGKSRTGVLSLTGPQGPADADSFARAVTRGVPDGTYRSVFAFSLDELSRLETLDEIKGSLFASATGLSVSPHDALRTLEGSAETIWSPSGRKKTRLSELAGRIRQIRADLALAEERSSQDSGLRDELGALRESLPELEQAAIEARERGLVLVNTAQSVADIDSELESARAEVPGLAGKAEESRQLLGETEVDDALLARAVAVDDCVPGLERFDGDLARSRALDGSAAALEAEATRLARSLGPAWDELATANVVADVAAEQELLRHGEAVQRADAEAVRAEERTREADDRLQHRIGVAQAALTHAGVEADVVAGAALAGARSEAVGRLLARPGVVPSAGRSPAARWPGWLAIGLGVLLGALGAIAGQWVALLGAIALVAAGVFMLLGGRANPPATGEPSAPEPALLAMLALDHTPTSAELVELKQRLDEAARKCGDTEEPAVEARAARVAVETSERTVAGAHREWAEWAATRGLAPDGTLPEPAQARAILLQVRQIQELIERARAEAEEAATLAERATGFAASFARAAGADPFDLDTAADRMAAIRAAIQAAREAAVERDALSVRSASGADALSATTAAIERFETRRRRVLEDAELSMELGAEHIAAKVQVAEERASDVARAERAARDRAKEIEGALGAQDGGAEEERLALTQAGLVGSLADLLEGYAVEALAARLLRETLADWERDRQPEVLRRAGELFSEITNGAYVRLHNPVGTFEPVVFGAHGASREADILSGGTAEQLYLAIRIAFIERNLSEAHEALPVLMDDPLVNFDAKRRIAAARMVAELAERRQVVVLTCHPEIVEAFELAALEHVRIDLDPCSV